MYHVMKVYIHQDHPLFSWCDTITKKANNLDNATLFRMRQVMTAVTKDPAALTANEAMVMAEVCSTAKKHGLAAPEKGHFFLSYKLLDKLFRDTGNPDFFADGLPVQSAQQIVKRVTKRMKAFFAERREYKKHPEKFTGEPKLPRYHKSGSSLSAIITNQDCVILPGENGRYYAKLPLTKTRCEIGRPSGKLKQAEVIPAHGIFLLIFSFDDGMEVPAVNGHPVCRIASIDTGVDNLAAVTFNTGDRGLIIKGGAVKAINQLYNKRAAAIRSEATKGGTKKFRPTPESEKLDLWRETRMDDCMHKSAAIILARLKELRIDTLVFGRNQGWKDGANLGKVNNQNFVQLPVAKLGGILKYLCERNGIRFVEQEESYTSKASFPDGDELPVYSKGQKPDGAFSGKRRPVRYKGMYKKDGFRGLYATKDGSIINADLNGSANIGRKAFPELYLNVSFEKPEIVKHPDLLRKNLITGLIGEVSKSKRKRLSRKQKSIPTGIGLCE